MYEESKLLVKKYVGESVERAFTRICSTVNQALLSVNIFSDFWPAHFQPPMKRENCAAAAAKHIGSGL